MIRHNLSQSASSKSAQKQPFLNKNILLKTIKNWTSYITLHQKWKKSLQKECILHLASSRFCLLGFHSSNSKGKSARRLTHPQCPGLIWVLQGQCNLNDKKYTWKYHSIMTKNAKKKCSRFETPVENEKWKKWNQVIIPATRTIGVLTPCCNDDDEDT